MATLQYTLAYAFTIWNEYTCNVKMSFPVLEMLKGLLKVKRYVLAFTWAHQVVPERADLLAFDKAATKWRFPGLC